MNRWEKKKKKRRDFPIKRRRNIEGDRKEEKKKQIELIMIDSFPSEIFSFSIRFNDIDRYIFN